MLILSYQNPSSTQVERTNLQIMSTVPELTVKWYGGVMLFEEICMRCWFKRKKRKKHPPKVMLCYFNLFPLPVFSQPHIPLVLPTDKRHSKEALFTEPVHSHLSGISWGKELNLNNQQTSWPQISLLHTHDFSFNRTMLNIVKCHDPDCTQDSQ